MATRIMFTGKVDHRYAWIGNDAEGSVDIFAELATLIKSATKSIALSTMTFSYGTGASATPADARVQQIAALLAQRAAEGIDVRIVGNGGHRFQPGYFHAQRGGAHLADNNLPALLHRISFQSSSAAPPGFLVDTGAPFGPRGGGLSYGWDQDVSASVGPKGNPDPSFTSPLLEECYARKNALGPRTWSIELPPGHYYVLVVTGEAAYGSKSFILAQGQTIFLRKYNGAYQYVDHTDTGPGEFSCSTVDGGDDSVSQLPMARRLEVVAGGRLEISVGNASDTSGSYSSLNYIEIYRASDGHPLGDPGLDRTRVQARALHHSKFVLIDAGTPSAKVWFGSHNFTPVDPAASDARSEDAMLTDEPGICAAFLAEFNQWWGTSSGAPNPAGSYTGIFKTPVIASGSMPSLLPGHTASWSVRFSPSKSGPGGVDMYATVADFLGPASVKTDDILMLMEQVTDGGTYSGPNGTFDGTTKLVALLRDKLMNGTLLQAVLGDTSPTEDIFDLATLPGAKVKSLAQIHDKLVIVDALRDNPTRARGKVLFGSMNFSQGAMHVNDEETLILQDPAFANQFLQRAARAFSDGGIALSRAADCVIVLDRSNSMNSPATAGSTKIAAARLAAKVFLGMLDQNGSHRVALVRFGFTVEPFSPPQTLAALTSASAPGLETAIDTTAATLPIGRATCYGRALQEAQNLLASTSAPHPRRFVVFLTDGLENTPPMASTVYPSMAAAGTEIHTTAFGAFAPTDTTGPNAILAKIATDSGGTFAQVDDDTIHLQKRFAEVARDAMGMVTILDPSFPLSPGQAFKQAFPVDMNRGLLTIVLLWGGQPVAPERVVIRTPWKSKITARTPGVTVRSGEGQQIWRIALQRLGARGWRRREVRGVWSVSARAPRRTSGSLRVELCVFASDTGVGRLVTDLVRIDGKHELRVRAFGGERVAGDARHQVFYRAPQDLQKSSSTAAELRLSAVRDARLTGVQVTELAATQAGIHEMRVVTEGQAPIEVPAGKGRKGTTTVTIPFRREQILRVFVPAEAAPAQGG